MGRGAYPGLFLSIWAPLVCSVLVPTGFSMGSPKPSFLINQQKRGVHEGVLKKLIDEESIGQGNVSGCLNSSTYCLLKNEVFAH